MPKKKTLREHAYETVLRVRGSNDVPAFDLCVEAELKRIKDAQLDRIAARRFGERLTMIDLKQFCSTDMIRVNLHNPFSQGEYTYATDGRIAVRVPRIMDFPEAEKPPVSKIFEQFFKDVPKGKIQAELPDVVPQNVACRECRGSGKEHDCPDCDCECENCDGDGTVPRIAKVCVAIGGALYDASYIKQVQALPGAKFSADPPKDDAAPFVFDGGEGILMPMRYAAVDATTIPATIQQ